MEIKPGSYTTRDGKKAYIYNIGKNMLEQECWVGTIEGIGFNTWDKDGKDLSGYSDLDLVEPLK